MVSLSKSTLIVIVIMVATGCGSADQPTRNPTSVPTPTPVSVQANQSSTTDELKLSLPAFPDNSHRYYVELLETALQATGQSIQIELTEPLPQKRAVQMFEQGKISMMYLVQSAERDSLYTPVEVGLTNGLIGKRVFLVPKGDADAYADIRTLAELQESGKVGVFGKDWFDAQVWAYNGLPYVEVDGDWRATTYGMVARGDRDVDYFSRGFTEILAEAAEHPDLEVENHIMLVYNRDFMLYLNDTTAPYKEVLQTALTHAKESGDMEALIRKYWADDFERLDFDNRVVIELETPK